ncbi:hypothetical protein OnM2_009020 [Erysiphe neolycopersici]|uniref:Uncharacterized protein n=1 Tax=Erysiphe neolycopersici TaxID=212602 RepID=A0A420I6Q2_9PEZI|nr:hypothetical protein OnM2_009020 [Erysiphe neolycopersici]
MLLLAIFVKIALFYAEASALAILPRQFDCQGTIYQEGVTTKATSLGLDRLRNSVFRIFWERIMKFKPPANSAFPKDSYYKIALDSRIKTKLTRFKQKTKPAYVIFTKNSPYASAVITYDGNKPETCKPSYVAQQSNSPKS